MPYGTIKVDTITFTSGSSDVSVAISGLVQNPTFSGDVTVTGTVSGTVVRGNTVSGATVTGTAGQFGTLTGNTAGFTTVTGTTVTGTTANFVTVSGNTLRTITGIFASGSAASPSITFSGDLDTGLFTGAGNTVGIAANGAAVLTVSGTSVGVGTSSPATALDVNGTVTCGTAGGVALSLANGTAIRNSAAVANTIYFDTSFGSATHGSFEFRSSNAATTRMIIDSSGRVGIGTSTVDELLHLKGASAASTTLKVESTATASERSSIHFFNGSVSRGRVGGSNDFDGLTLDSSTTESAAAIRFRTGGTSLTTKMTLTSGGSLGIGTTSPATTVHAVGTVRISRSDEANQYLNLYSSLGEGFIDAVNSNSPINQPIIFRSGNNSTTTERARIDNSGRLLVGTSSARANFFNSATAPQFQIEGSTLAGATASVARSSADAFGPIIALGKSRNASVGGNTVVNSGDECGTLDFQGNDGTEFVTLANIIAAVDGTPGANDMPGRLVFSTTADGASSPTERMRIQSDGTKEFSNGSLKLLASAISSGAGNSTLKYNTTTGIVTYDTSSRLVKRQIVDCPYGIDELKQLQPRKYFRTDDQREEIGFIADEMAQVMPEFVPIGPKSVVTKNEDDAEQIPIGVNYEKLTAVLTKGLQEAITKIETLEAKVAALESA